MPDTLIRVRLTPRGGRDGIEGWIDDPEYPGKLLLKARVAAAPVDGGANSALIRLLAKTLKVSRSRIVITSGQTSRTKTLSIEGLSSEDVRRMTFG